MLSISDSLEKMAMFAIDIAGMATKYDFSIIRWGFGPHWNCIVNPQLNESHQQWLAVDIALDDPSLEPQFKTDCAIAGMYCKTDDTFIHVQNTPIPEVV